MPQSKPNRILFLPSWYPNKTEPASGNFIQRLVEAASAFDNVAVLFTMPVAGLTNEYEILTRHEQGFPEVIVYYDKTGNRSSKALRRFKAYQKGFEYLTKSWGVPELVNVQVAFPAVLYAWWLKVRKGIPYVLTEHGLSFYKSYEAGIKFALVKHAIKKADKIITVSRFLAEAMSNKGIKGPFDVIPNMVPLPLALPDIKPSGNIKRILHISTLAEVKNISGILRAVKNISNTRKDFELVILSTKEERINTVEYCKSLGLDNSVVKFNDYITDVNEIAKFILACNFMLLFSNYETFSIVLAESLWAGRPVVTSKCGGPQEFINENFGLLVEPGDEKGLEKAINKMLDTWSSYDSAKMKEFARAHFAPEVIGNKMHLLHSEICLRYKSN